MLLKRLCILGRRRGETPSYFRRYALDGSLQVLNLRQMFAEQETMMIINMARERRNQLLLIGTNPPDRKACSSVGIGFPISNGSQNHAYGFAHHITHDISQFHVGIF